MRIRDLRLAGIRCFEDTGDIVLDPKFNIFVGKNNAGKSSILKAILGLQGFPFDGQDLRPGNEQPAFVSVSTEPTIPAEGPNNVRYTSVGRGQLPTYGDLQSQIGFGQSIFSSARPSHILVPFVAKRKAASPSHDVSLGVQSQLNGTLSSLYSRVDLLATYGHPDHDKFREAIAQIVGLEITMKASPGGKEAGFYFNKEIFVTLDRMGDGVSEMVALIVELCTEENKIFVLEEPETNLHPRGLKALLAMIREASERNQFVIATHSNVVVRELGGLNGGKVFRVFRDGEAATSPSKIEQVERTPTAHVELLRELGYEFTDLDLYDGWLFLEESSAERVIRDILIPNFAPRLMGRIRTYSAGGATNLEPSITEFERLIVFVHLQPIYKGRLWIRADGDNIGTTVVKNIRAKFPYLNEESLCNFSKEHFELYYPEFFKSKVSEVLSIKDRNEIRKQKAELLQNVLNWTRENKERALVEWELSAQEQIETLRLIEKKLLSTD